MFLVILFLHICAWLELFAIKDHGGNSQNILGKFVRFFVTLMCFYGVVIYRKYICTLYSS